MNQTHSVPFILLNYNTNEFFENYVSPILYKDYQGFYWYKFYMDYKVVNLLRSVVNNNIFCKKFIYTHPLDDVSYSKKLEFYFDYTDNTLMVYNLNDLSKIVKLIKECYENVYRLALEKYDDIELIVDTQYEYFNMNTYSNTFGNSGLHNPSSYGYTYYKPPIDNAKMEWYDLERGFVVCRGVSGATYDVKIQNLKLTRRNKIKKLLNNQF